MRCHTVRRHGWQPIRAQCRDGKPHKRNGRHKRTRSNGGFQARESCGSRMPITRSSNRMRKKCCARSACSLPACATARDSELLFGSAIRPANEELGLRMSRRNWGEANPSPCFTSARGSAVWIATVALLCVVGCSRNSQSGVFQSGTPQALEAIVCGFAEQNRLPGLAAGVYQRGEVILRMGVGHQDGPASPPIDGETVFHLASVTKPFVATAAMQLVAEGKMCLDCPLRRYLPYFYMEGPGADRITIRQILTHTAGMGDTNNFGWTTPEYDDGAVERYVRSLAPTRLDFAPGSDWRYSNRGFDVLADAIAKADGQPFEAVIQRRILTPLGMRRSTLLMSDIDSARMALGHRRDGTVVG